MAAQAAAHQVLLMDLELVFQVKEMMADKGSNLEIILRAVVVALARSVEMLVQLSVVLVA